MAHYNRYDSTQIKKSKERKERAKTKSGKTNIEKNYSQFILNTTNRATGTVIEVKYDEAIIFYEGMLIKAKLKKGMNIVCNKMLFPGDVVLINKAGKDEYYISNLIKRKNLLSRTKKDSTRNSINAGSNQNIAANIDVAVIVVSSKTPPLHPKFIDRYLLILQDNNIDCIIC